MSLNSVVDPYVKANEYINCIDSLENLEEDILKTEETLEVKKAVSKLAPQEMELVTMVYYKGLSLKNYAEKKGMTYYEATKKKDYVLYKLGNHFKQ